MQKKSARIWIVPVLALLILLGPRLPLEFGGTASGLRLQDFLLFPLAIWAVLDHYSWKRKMGGSTLRSTWWIRPVWGFVAVLTVTTAIAVLRAEYGDARLVAYGGRALEYLVLYAVVVRALDGDQRGLKHAWTAVGVGVALNVLWVFIQEHALGNPGVVYGEAFLLEGGFSYGPMLIGEPSPFGAGMTLTLGVSYVVGLLVCGGHAKAVGARLGAVAATGSILWAIVLVNSRAGLLSATIAIVVTLLLRLRPRRVIAWLVGLAVVAGAGALLSGPVGDRGRLSEEGIEYSMEVRIDRIWGPLLEDVGARPITGYGPGALGEISSLPQTEAHSYMLRLAVEHGVLAPVVFVGALIALGRIAGPMTGEMGLRGQIAATWIVFTAGSLAAALVQDAFFPAMHGQLFWLVSGVMVAARAVEGAPTKERQASGGVSRLGRDRPTKDLCG
jgi:hypothetical protein